MDKSSVYDFSCIFKAKVRMDIIWAGLAVKIYVDWFYLSVTFIVEALEISQHWWTGCLTV